MMYVKCKSIKYSTIPLNYKKCINFIAINLYCNLTINCSPSGKTIAVISDWCQIIYKTFMLNTFVNLKQYFTVR